MINNDQNLKLLDVTYCNTKASLAYPKTLVYLKIHYNTIYITTLVFIILLL